MTLLQSWADPWLVITTFFSGQYLFRMVLYSLCLLNYYVIAFKWVSLSELWHERKAFQKDGLIYVYISVYVFFSVSVGGVKFSVLVAFAWLTLPICFPKQVISIIQLIVLCINTARLDESERERVNKWLAIEAEKPNGILPLWTHSDWCQ